MRKLTAIASVLLFTLAPLITPSIAENPTQPKNIPKKLELKVGMPMPRPKGNFVGFLPRGNFILAGYKPMIGDIPEVIEVYQRCGEYPEKFPFASYNYRTERLYLDTIKENNSPGPDGKIDFIIPNSKTIPPFQFAPKCPQPL